MQLYLSSILLVNHQCRQGRVGNGYSLVFAALDVDLCNRVIRELVAGGWLGLFDGQPAVLDALQDDLTRLVCLEGPRSRCSPVSVLLLDHVM